MGCCNKVYDEKPISRSRWIAGLFVVVAAHVFVGVLLTLGAPFSARYRKALAGWRGYSRDVLRACLAKEGFTVGRAAVEACECGYRPPEGGQGS